MHRETILVVDDKESNIDVVVNILKLYRVIVSLDATNALEILKLHKIDLILLDIMMPKIDGFELCSMIKAEPSLKDIPILFLTAKNDIGSIERGYELGGVDYVTKPFHPKELLSRVVTHLKMRDIHLNLQNLVDEGIKKIQYQDQLLMAREKSAEMGEMIDTIAHQWTQPLNLIHMRLHSLKYDYEDKIVDGPYIQEMTEKSILQVHHMVDTLQEFRSFLSTDKALESFDATGMIYGCLLLLKDELEKHSIETVFKETENFTINAIENEVQHILLNILGNAKDALNEKDIKDKKIVIAMHENSITITDNALGINPYIFDSIFSSNVSTKKGSGGSGMGLYISKKIAQKFSIKLFAKNEKDGANFTLEFPS